MWHTQRDARVRVQFVKEVNRKEKTKRSIVCVYLLWLLTRCCQMQQTKIHFGNSKKIEIRARETRNETYTRSVLFNWTVVVAGLAYIRITNEMKNKFNAIRLPVQCQRVVSAWAVARHKLHYIRATKHRNIHAEDKREKNVQLNLCARIFTVKASIEFLEN